MDIRLRQKISNTNRQSPAPAVRGSIEMVARTSPVLLLRTQRGTGHPCSAELRSAVESSPLVRNLQGYQVMRMRISTRNAQTRFDRPSKRQTDRLRQRNKETIRLKSKFDIHREFSASGRQSLHRRCPTRASSVTCRTARF